MLTCKNFLKEQLCNDMYQESLKSKSLTKDSFQLFVRYQFGELQVSESPLAGRKAGWLDITGLTLSATPSSHGLSLRNPQSLAIV